MKRSVIMGILLCIIILAMAACAEQGSSSSRSGAILTPSPALSPSTQVPSPTPTPAPLPTPTPTPTPAPLPTSTPTPAPLPSPTPTLTLTDTAMMYYQAIKDHNYTVAYSYLDANATTIQGQKLTLKLFVQLAKNSENAEGPISSFSVAAFPPLVVMTVSRNFGPYHVHLQVKKEGSNWKITSLDRI